ncbi:MAG: DNA-binding response regulator [Bacilli bacterium]|nr:DNA-binding response regulator [Bacilli bacterium]
MGIRLLIADDDPIVREGLRMILGMDEQFEIVACVENGLQAVEFCVKHQVDIALLDVRMPEMNGVQAVKEICSKTKTKPLILTTFDDDAFIIEAIRNGARGYLLKSNTPEKIKDAIRMIHGGNTVMQDTVLNTLIEGLANKGSKLDRSLFSDRDVEIMDLISKGLSNKEIAKELYITEGTTANYITSIFNKTGLEHRTQIAIFYLNGGKR